MAPSSVGARGPAINRGRDLGRVFRGRLNGAGRWVSGWLLAVALASCQSDDPTPTPSVDAPLAAPSVELTDETPGTLLTWLDSDGEFHVVESVSEVPAEGRSQVRVVIPEQHVGTGESVLVADLTNKDETGHYALRTISRSAWNELGAERRKVRLEASLAPSASPTAALDAPTDPGLTAKVKATIYGASWCKPCHDAEALLKKLGVSVVKKDIEESRAAQAEMQTKLQKAGRGGASIPVIDVAGELFVGFNANVLKQAVRRAANKLSAHSP